MLRRVLALALVALSAAGAAVAATRPPARVQVTATEYRFTLSRFVLRAGPAIVQLANFGEDPHDLRLRRVGGKHVWGSPVVQPGDQFDLVAKLPPGKYVLWCSVADHRARGMRATLVVKK